MEKPKSIFGQPKSFDLHFFNDYWYLASFHVLIAWKYVYSLEKCLFKFYVHFLIGLFEVFWLLLYLGLCDIAFIAFNLIFIFFLMAHVVAI